MRQGGACETRFNRSTCSNFVQSPSSCGCARERVRERGRVEEVYTLHIPPQHGDRIGDTKHVCPLSLDPHSHSAYVAFSATMLHDCAVGRHLSVSMSDVYVGVCVCGGVSCV